MATAIATLQQVGDCRWSRPGYRLTGLPDRQQPESAWVCVREGIRRSVSQEECQSCSHFELTPGRAMRAAFVTREAAVATGMTATEVLAFSTRAILVLNAALFAIIGIATLTSPLAVPFTVSMWLCAAGFAGLAVFWRMESP